MIIIHDYGVAVLFCVFSMACWGSWANTQKLAAKNWRFELYYWDLTIGILLTSILAAFTVGSLGDEGRTFVEDLNQADSSSIINAILGGIIWNLGNILLVAAIAVAGMAVGFPIGGGIAWILGIMVNFALVVLDKGEPQGNVTLLFLGMLIIILAIYLSMLLYRQVAKKRGKPSAKGILLSVTAGLLIAFFYGLVVKSLDNTFVSGGTGKLTPFTGIFFFAVGVFISTPLINPIFMRFPVEGKPVKMKEYFKGNILTHLTGIAGGFIWTGGMIFSFMAAGASNPAVAYALSNAAPVVAILWGAFAWNEFKGGPKGTNKLLAGVLITYVIGLMLITFSNT